MNKVQFFKKFSKRIVFIALMLRFVERIGLVSVMDSVMVACVCAFYGSIVALLGVSWYEMRSFRQAVRECRFYLLWAGVPLVFLLLWLVC